jgi:hypothetical protein
VQKDIFTVSDFRQVVWPSIEQLTKLKELPAQSIYYLLKHTEVLQKYAPSSDFLNCFVPLMQKSLECGVAKLQILTIDKIQGLQKALDYSTFKNNLLPRILQILETSADVQAKTKVLEFIRAVQETIDQQSLQGLVFKTLEKARSKETDPGVCMLIL